MLTTFSIVHVSGRAGPGVVDAPAPRFRESSDGPIDRQTVEYLRNF